MDAKAAAGISPQGRTNVLSIAPGIENAAAARWAPSLNAAR